MSDYESHLANDVERLARERDKQNRIIEAEALAIEALLSWLDGEVSSMVLFDVAEEVRAAREAVE